MEIMIRMMRLMRSLIYSENTTITQYYNCIDLYFSILYFSFDVHFIICLCFTSNILASFHFPVWILLCLCITLYKDWAQCCFFFDLIDKAFFLVLLERKIVYSAVPLDIVLLIFFLEFRMKYLFVHFGI